MQAQITPISQARTKRTLMVQGQLAEAKEEKPMKDPDNDVKTWVNQGFRGLLAVAVSLLLSFGGWIVVSLNQISQSTSIMATEFTATKVSVGELKVSVDSLRLRAEGWATKDHVAVTKDQLLDQIGKLKEQVNALELRVKGLESSGRR